MLSTLTIDVSQEVASLTPLRPYPQSFPVVFLCDKYYFRYCAIAIGTLMANRRPALHYEITILTNEDLDAQEVEEFSTWLERFAWVDLRIVKLINLPEFKQVNYRITTATYLRLYIPQLFADYNRVLYLDSDICVVKDLSNLLSWDFQGKVLAGCSDLYSMHLFTGFSFLETSIPIPDDLTWNSYCQEKGLDPLSYINAGVLLFNTALIKERGETHKLLEVGEKLSKELLLFADQDIVNVYAKGEISYLSNCYNHNSYVFEHWDGGIYRTCNANTGEFNERAYFEQDLHPIFIYHYIGVEKPWYLRGEVYQWLALAYPNPLFKKVEEEFLYEYNEELTHFLNYRSMGEWTKGDKDAPWAQGEF